MEKVDEKIVQRFKGDLNTILLSEIAAGNWIVETYESKEPDHFPLPNAIMIFLEKPFLTPVRKDLPNIHFRTMNDPHYWKDEYFDEENIQFLCCKFG